MAEEGLLAPARGARSPPAAPRAAPPGSTGGWGAGARVRQWGATTTRGRPTSRGVVPDSTAKSRATSSTQRPIGPGLSWLALIGTTWVAGTAPTVGFSPTTPLTDAGQTIDPSVSVPTASGVSPAARAQGLATSPPVADQPLVERAERMLAHWLRLVLAMTTAPAARSRATSGASREGRPMRAVEPAVPASPSASTLSLTTTGTPCSTPSAAPRARSSSRALATARASGATDAMARSATGVAGPSIASMRSSSVETSSSELSWPPSSWARVSATDR